MSKRVILVVLLMLVLGIEGVFAQGQGAASLAQTIDTRAASYGLPSGDGTISAGEQAVASAMVDAVTAFDQDVNTFESESPDNSAWVGQLEDRVQQLNTDVEQAVRDPRAEAISNAIAQYGQDVQPIADQPPVRDPRAEAIAHAVEQYGQETVLDPRAEAIRNAVEQYGQEPTVRDPRAEAIAHAIEQYGQQVRDPRAEAIAHAIEQYGQEQGPGQLSLEDQRRVADTVRSSADDYINHSSVKRRGITKRYINHIIQIMVPQHLLPIDGYWRALPYTTSTSGQCLGLPGDNGGMGATDVDNDPGQPLCGYENAGGLPYLTWQGQVQPYLPGSSSIYSQEPQVSYETTFDSNGASNGSTRSYSSWEYEVVAPDRIIVHYVRQESGGCNTSGDYVLELVTADESVCGAETPWTPEPPTPTPPPAQEGPYQVGSPIFNDEKDCNERNSPPDFGDELRLIAQGDDSSLVVDYGTGTQTVYKQSDGYYEFDSGMAAAVRVVFSVVIFDDGSGGSLSWSGNAKDGKICFVTRDLTLPGADQPDAFSTPAPDMGSSDGASLAGDFSVTWSGYPMMECPAALEESLPNFANAAISAVDGGYQLDVDGASYLLVETTQGQYSYMVFNADNTGIVIVVSAGDAGHLLGTFTLFAADGSMCAKQLDYAPAG